MKEGLKEMADTIANAVKEGITEMNKESPLSTQRLINESSAALQRLEKPAHCGYPANWKHLIK